MTKAQVEVSCKTEIAGDHTHIRVFVGPEKALAGILTMRSSEAPAVLEKLGMVAERAQSGDDGF